MEAAKPAEPFVDPYNLRSPLDNAVPPVKTEDTAHSEPTSTDAPPVDPVQYEKVPISSTQN